MDDGRAEWTALPGDLAEVAEEDVGPLSRIFAHAANKKKKILQSKEN